MKARIHIVQGAEVGLRLHAEKLAVRESRPLVLHCNLDPVQSWLGVRQMLSQCLEELGEERVLEVLGRHAEAASLVLDSWRTSRAQVAVQGHARLAARLESHLTHNWAVQRPLITGWAKILSELIHGEGFCVIVPCVNFLDWETLATLKTLYGLDSQGHLRFVVGYDRNLEAEEQDDNGIKWRKRPDYVRQAVLDFLSSPEARYVEVAPRPGEKPPADDLPGAFSPLVEGLEVQAAIILGRPGDLDSAGRRKVVEAMEACFCRYSFTAALHLGVELFRRSPEMRGPLAARAHTVIALSAHNRQFKSEGNLVLGRFIAHHLESALEQEQRPAVRCALLYRLTVTYSRRLGQLDVAERWASSAIEEAEKLEGAGLKYQKSWARNIYAYVATRQKDPDKARDLMAAAFDDVSVPQWVGESPSTESSVEGDFALTRSLVAHNLAVADLVAGNPQGYSEMLQIACQLEAKIERSAKYWAQSLVPHCKQLNRPDLALPAAHEGRLAAARDKNASLLLLFTLQVADLEYRLGRAKASAEHYVSARVLASKLSSVEAYPDFDVPAVSALEEAGDLNRAEEILRSKLESKSDSQSEIGVATLSRLAVLSARRGDAAAAEKWASEATDLAARCAVRHLLVRTGLELGRAAKILGRAEEAVGLLKWALDLIEDRTDSASVSPVDELMVLTELGRSSSLTPGQAQRSLSLLVDCLSSSSGAWWSLPDALTLWLPLCSEQTSGSRFGGPELQTLLAAGELRDDCRGLVQEVRESLGHLLGPALVATAGFVRQKRSSPTSESFRE